MMTFYIDLVDESEHYFNLRDNNLRMILDEVNAIAERHFIINEVKYRGFTWYGMPCDKYRYLLYQRIDEERVESIELYSAPNKPPQKNDVENFLYGFLVSNDIVKCQYRHVTPLTAPSEKPGDQHWLL